MGENKTEMDSPPGCSSSEDGISDINELSILATPGDRIQKSEVGTPVLNQSCDADNSVDGHTPKSRRRRRKKPSHSDPRRQKRRPFPYNKNGLDTDSVPSPHIPVSRRHEILKARLDQANQDIERMRPMEEENIKLRQRVVELEGEVMKLRSINRSIKRDRTQSLSEASFET